MKAIPTMYAGVQFRSRLEARWAAFFDLLGWQWDYEPIDLNGYIPDFLVKTGLHKFDDSVLVEVKPFTSLTESLDEVKAKIDRSGCDKSIVIVGARLHPYEGNERLCTYTTSSVRVGAMGFRGHWFAADISEYGFDHNDHDSCTCVDDEEEARVIRLGREAGNRVQWRSPRKTHVAARHEDSLRNWLTNEHSWNAESPEAFCDRCGYPTGHEHPGYGHPETGFFHINEEKCREFADENARRTGIVVDWRGECP